jgi:tRNA 5-methylaminomethyl-2-thiouridine biosynthesis bifunctional protein
VEKVLQPRKLEQARHIPRVEGLYVLCALGSRGITLAPLLGHALASWVTGWPQPVGADLLDAIDPARFFSKRLRSLAKAA